MSPNTWAMICHLSGLAGYLGNGIGSIVAPLVVWLIKKDEIPEVDHHGKEALNFNISIAIYMAAMTMLTLCTFGVAAILTIPGIFALMVFHAVCVIIATLKANNGEDYRYPLCLRLIK